MDRESTIKLLKQYGALTVDMADSFVRGETEIVVSNESAVMIKHPGGVHMLWAIDYESSVRALEEGNINGMCVVHGTPAQKAFIDRYGQVCLGKPCIQYCRLSRKPFDIPMGYDIRPLTQKDLDFVMEHYDMADSPDYISWRIDCGELQGAYVDGKLAGFIGSHSDGSIGMLEVLPEYRRMGIATALEFYQMNRHIEKGYTPYGQVYYDNDSSHLLQKKVGLDISDDTIAWGGTDWADE